MHGDTNATFLVGDVDAESRRLVEVTRECLERAIAVVAPDVPFNEIGRAIQEHAEANGFGVVRSFVGHGIGEQFHTDLHDRGGAPGRRGEPRILPRKRSAELDAGRGSPDLAQFSPSVFR